MLTIQVGIKMAAKSSKIELYRLKMLDSPYAGGCITTLEAFP
jgi:hypothetical protein